MPADPVVIVSAKRTPTGAFQGALSGLASTDLGAHALKATLANVCIDKEMIDEVIMGCVLQAGLGQAPARQAALKAGFSPHTLCSTLNKVCGSGMKAIMNGYDSIMAGSSSVVMAGGMESMTNAPYFIAGARQGLRMGHQQLMDHMMWDGLQDASTNGTAMGLFAENLAEKYALSRQTQDNYAIQTATRALEAQKNGLFQAEISPLTVPGKIPVEITQDEPPQRIKLDKIPDLKPAFKKDGTITAANASSISDGASAVLLMREGEALERGLTPLARIVGHASYSREPEWFTLAPVGAIERLLKKVGWRKDQVDLFEINEAFAVVTLAAIKDLDLDSTKVNVHGGACALGHAIGSSGARLVVTLLHALNHHQKTYGIASLCIGGGEAVALAVERL